LTNKNRGSWIHTAQRAHFVAKQLHSLLTRSQSLSERLRNEINLAFNLVSQKDSAMMKTVAVVSMVYLPGTFISVCSSLRFGV
jgi:Mg2+ and Co2+ transporter CorA